MGQDRILVVGATGYIGQHVVKASARLGYPTFALIRASTEQEGSKADLLNSLKAAGVTFLFGSLEDHSSLVEALKEVDVVISTVGSTQVLQQAKLIEAIKEVGHIKRFLPSEFGNDVHRVHSLPPSESIFGDKVVVQDQIKAAGIPYTIVVSGSFAGYFAANLGQGGHYAPPKDKAEIYGDAKAIFLDEDDIGTYTIKAAVDPRAENKVLYIRPAHNILTHLELVELWEKKSGHQLQKSFIGKEEFLKRIEETPAPLNALLAIVYSILIEGDQTSFDVPSDGVEATQLYPDVEYTTIEKYFERFL